MELPVSHSNQLTCTRIASWQYRCDETRITDSVVRRAIQPSL